MNKIKYSLHLIIKHFEDFMIEDSFGLLLLWVSHFVGVILVIIGMFTKDICLELEVVKWLVITYIFEVLSFILFSKQYKTLKSQLKDLYANT